MPKIKKNPPVEKDRRCGNCKHYHLILLDEMHYEWGGPWACKNEKVNPDHKDPKEGIMCGDRMPCGEWLW